MNELKIAKAKTWRGSPQARR